VSEGRRNEFAAFGWNPREIPDPQDPATFLESKLNWAELDKEPHRELLEWHRELVALRRAHADLTDGRLEQVDVRFKEAEQWMVLARGSIAVACNLSSGRQALPIPFHGALLLASSEECLVRGTVVDLPPEGVAVVGDTRRRIGA
jgi:maltooligosyltrehalose trehalohydrolase